MDKLFELLKEKIDNDVMTEEFQTELKASMDALIEAKAQELVDEKVKTIVEEKEKELEEKALIEMEEFKSELVEKLDDYMNYATEEFFTKNEVAIISETKVDLAEKIISSVKDVLGKYGVEIEPEQVSQIDQLKEEVTTIKSEIDEKIKETISLKDELFEAQKEIEFMKLTSALTDKQKAKASELMEGVTFTDLEDYVKKVTIFVEKVSSEEDKIEESVQQEDLDKKLQEQSDESKPKIHPSLNARKKA